GRAYTHEVIVKQTIGRAISTWVHQAPPWFYVLHLPGVLFPWFLAAVAAVRGANRFYINWILAVIVPYSLMSSKLDVYMMAMIPPVALMIADAVEDRRPRLSVEDSRPRLSGRARSPVLWANRIALILFLAAPIALPWVPAMAKPLLVAMAIASAIGLLTWRSPIASTIAVGLVPLVPLVFAACTMMPFVNEVGSTRNLIAAIEKQRVAPESVA